MSQPAWGLLTVALTLLGSYLVARLGSRAEARKAELAASVEQAKTKQAGDVSVGQLAMDIATRAETKADRLEKKVDRLDGWRQEVQAWWPVHNRLDQIVMDELELLDPTFARRMPAPVPLPRYDDDTEGRTG